MSSKGSGLRFRRINSNAFGHGSWRASVSFASRVLIVPLVHSSNPVGWEW